MVEPKQSSSLLPYSNREILDSFESGRIPEALSDWLDLDKLVFKDGNLDLAILERNETGAVLSLKVITLTNASTRYLHNMRLIMRYPKGKVILQIEIITDYNQNNQKKFTFWSTLLFTSANYELVTRGLQ